MGKRLGIVVISFGLLEQILHLPEGHRVYGLRVTDTLSDTFEVCIEGPSLGELPEGRVIPRVRYEVSVTEDPELVRTRTFVGKFIEETRG